MRQARRFLKEHPWIGGWLASALFMLGVLLIHPIADIGLNDDWSYFYTTKILAEAGHLTYNGWATAMLGWQVYLGALFATIFGFSFTTVRCANILVAAVTVPLLHSVLVRFRVRPWHALVGTVLIGLSPMFFGLGTSYMTDVNGLFCLLLCIYGCKRGVDADCLRSTLLWFCFAAAASIAGGTVRQIMWLGVLLMVPSSAWLRRDRKVLLAATAWIWVVSAVCIAAAMHWYGKQPYVISERLITLTLDGLGAKSLLKAACKSILTLDLFLSPLLLAFALRFPWKERELRRVFLSAGILLITPIVVLSLRGDGVRWISFLLGNYVTGKGILELPSLLGQQPDVIPRAVQALVLTGMALVSLACALVIWHRRRTTAGKLRSQEWTELVWIFCPFLAGYLALIFTRVSMFDRYWLPVMCVLVLFALLLFQERFQDDMSAIVLILVAVFAAYGIAGTHDLFSASRARVAAADTLRRLGVPRTAIGGGFEYDGWTQIESTGYINDARIKTPAHLYHAVNPTSNTPKECSGAFEGYTPSVHPRYVLSHQPDFCFANADIPAVPYKTWLSPHDRAVYILKVP